MRLVARRKELEATTSSIRDLQDWVERDRRVYEASVRPSWFRRRGCSKVLEIGGPIARASCMKLE